MCHKITLFLLEMSSASPPTVAATVATNVSTPLSAAASAISTTVAPVVVVNEPIFLETKTAQAVAGLFVFTALFLTCQQVSVLSRRTQPSLDS